MDRERLGRVLGRGARMAARTAMEAVDAATAAAPAGSNGPRVAPASERVRSQVRPPLQGVRMPQNVRPAFAAARAGVLTPLRRASRALWHELTGSFFALFAFSFGVGVWHTRAHVLSSVASERYRFLAFFGLMLLFAYFSVSSFLRARRSA